MKKERKGSIAKLAKEVGVSVSVIYRWIDEKWMNAFVGESSGGKTNRYEISDAEFNRVVENRRNGKRVSFGLDPSGEKQ